MNKWNPIEWLEANPLEYYLGTEDITIPAAEKLVEQSGLVVPPIKLSSYTGTTPTSTGPSTSTSTSTSKELVSVLDLGAGLGQVSSSISQAISTNRISSSADIRIVAGEYDESLLAELHRRKGENQDGRWSMVDVEKMDALNTGKPDNSFDYLFGNFVYFLTANPVEALKESIRVVKPGGTLGLTSWAYSGPFHLIQHGISLLDSYPLPSGNAPGAPGGLWTHPSWLRQTLAENGMVDIKITPYEFYQYADSAAEMSRKMHHVVKILTSTWGEEQRVVGWKVFEKIEELLRRDQGDGRVRIRSVALIVTAKKP